MSLSLTGRELQNVLNEFSFVLSNKENERDSLMKSFYIDYDTNIDFKIDYLDLLLSNIKENKFDEIFQKLSLNNSKTDFVKTRIFTDNLLNFIKLLDLNKEISSLILLVKLCLKKKIKKSILDFRKLIFQVKVNINYSLEEDENLLANVYNATFFNNFNLNLWTLKNYKIKLIT